MIRAPAEVRHQTAAVVRKARAARTRALLAERFGHDVTDEESAGTRRKMRDAIAAHRAALAEAESYR